MRERAVADGRDLTDAMEDYLEAILELHESKGTARVKDIAQRLEVRMPTVTEAIQGLVRRGLVRHERYEDVGLTRKGREVARETQRRHAGIRRFLTELLGLRRAQAEREACAIEHAMRPATVDRLLEFVERAQGRADPDGRPRGRSRDGRGGRV